MQILLPDFISMPSPLSKARGGKLIANDLMVQLKNLGTVNAKVEERIVI